MNRDLKNKYWIFGLLDYSPAGGMEDFLYSTNDFSVAKEYCEKNQNDHTRYEIFDRGNAECHYYKNSEWHTYLLD